MYQIEKQLIRLVHVTALSALMRETKNLDKRTRIRAKLEQYAFPEDIEYEL